MPSSTPKYLGTNQPTAQKDTAALSWVDTLFGMFGGGNTPTYLTPGQTTPTNGTIGATGNGPPYKSPPTTPPVVAAIAVAPSPPSVMSPPITPTPCPICQPCDHRHHHHHRPSPRPPAHPCPLDPTTDPAVPEPIEYADPFGGVSYVVVTPRD